MVPAGGNSTIHISFTPVVLGPGVLHKVECVGYALGFLSLDDEVSTLGLGRASPHPTPPHLTSQDSSDGAWAW